MLTLVLGGRGYEVKTYASGAAFLQSPPSQACQVMLLDMRMPGMNGLELYARMKAAGYEMPVIYMSGESQPHETLAAQQSGAVHFLWKPFSTREMLSVIEGALANT